MSKEGTLSIDLSHSSIILVSSAIRHLQGKLQTNVQKSMQLAESMYDVYGDFDHSDGIELIEEPLGKIINKNNKDLALCEELMRAFDHFCILIKSQEHQPTTSNECPNHGSLAPLQEEDDGL